MFRRNLIPVWVGILVLSNSKHEAPNPKQTRISKIKCSTRVFRVTLPFLQPMPNAKPFETLGLGAFGHCLGFRIL